MALTGVSPATSISANPAIKPSPAGATSLDNPAGSQATQIFANVTAVLNQPDTAGKEIGGIYSGASVANESISAESATLDGAVAKAEEGRQDIGASRA